MISRILADILAYILFISFILCFSGGCIYLIIDGIRNYLDNTEGLYLFEIVTGCVGVMIITIIVLGAFGL